MQTLSYLAAVIFGLFNPARLQALLELFAVFRQLLDLTTVARSLMVQLHNMPTDTHTPASGNLRGEEHARPMPR